MPYCDHETRERIDHGHPAQNVGELTYELQQTVQRYLLNKLANGEELSYTLLSTVTAALHNCGVDFEDRILMPYEAVKAATNGDVWDARLIATNRDVFDVTSLEGQRHEFTQAPTEHDLVSAQRVACDVAVHGRNHFPHHWVGPDETLLYCTGGV